MNPANANMSSQSRSRNPDQAEEGQAASDSLITQEHCLQLVENLRKFYEDEYCFLYDVKLVSKDGGQVRAHRVILAAQSDYFKVMFSPATGTGLPWQHQQYQLNISFTNPT